MRRAITYLIEALSGRRAHFALLGLNALVALGVAWGSRHQVLTDTWSYLGLAEGILHGTYSMWWPLGDDWPDTFRAPGYSLLVAGVLALFGNWKAMYVVNLLLYAYAITLTMRIIARFDDRLLTRNLFLLLLLPLVNVPFYITQLYTEMPVMAAITAALYYGTGRGRWSVGIAVVMGLLFGFIEQCKPVFLLFPLFFAAFAWWTDRRRINWRGQGIALAVYALCLLPYGFWNLRNHGVFRVTPIEGGPGYMQLGYWAGKTPGYVDTFHLHNFMGDEIVRFVPEEDVPKHIAEYEREWRDIKERIDPLRTRADSIMLASRSLMPHPVENTWNTKLTLERERLLKEATIRNMLNDPWYTLKYKAYSAVRLWVIGIQRGDFQKAGIAGKMRMLHATLYTGLILLLFLALVPWAYRRGALSWRGTWPMLLLLAYVGLLHIPFTIQARYTTPVRLIMLALIAIALTRCVTGRSGTGSERPPA